MILLMTSNLAWETTLLCVCSKWGLWAAPFYSVLMGKIDEQWWTYQTNPFWIIINPSFFLGETIENPCFFFTTFRPRDPKNLPRSLPFVAPSQAELRWAVGFQVSVVKNSRFRWISDIIYITYKLRWWCYYDQLIVYKWLFRATSMI